MIDGTLSLRDAYKVAERLGCEIEGMRRSGEVRIVPPEGQGRPLIINRRKKDANKKFMSLLRRLEKEQRGAVHA